MSTARERWLASRAADDGDGDGDVPARARPPVIVAGPARPHDFGTTGPVRAGGTGLARWADVDHTTLPRSVHDARGTDLASITTDAVYETALGGIDAAPTDVLSIRFAQHYAAAGPDTPDETWNPIGRDLDLTVELDDGARQAAVRLGTAGAVHYPLPGFEACSVFRTVRLPLDMFTAVNPALDLRSLQRLRLRPLRATGRVLIDDVEIETAFVTAPARVSLLRLHELGTGFGPDDDRLDTDVVVRLAGRPRESFRFRLRPGPTLRAARGMLATLRAAFVENAPVRICYVLGGPSVRYATGVVTTGPVPPQDERGTGFGPAGDHIDVELDIDDDQHNGILIRIELRRA